VAHQIVDFVRQKVSVESEYFIEECNSLDAEKVDLSFTQAFENLSVKSSQVVLIHPPYLDIVKFIGFLKFDDDEK
jgi:hypothetical protein